jgi:hypothetical protein
LHNANRAINDPSRPRCRDRGFLVARGH